MKHEVLNLKPCPFCGADAFMWSWNYGTAIQCSKFNAKSHLVQVREKTSAAAVKKWNTRHRKVRAKDENQKDRNVYRE